MVSKDNLHHFKIINQEVSENKHLKKHTFVAELCNQIRREKWQRAEAVMRKNCRYQ